MLIKEAKFVISNSGGKLLRHVKMFIIKRITMKNHLEDEIYFRCTNTTSFLLKIKFSQGEGQDYRQFEDAVDARMLHLKYKIVDISELLLNLSPTPSLRGPCCLFILVMNSGDFCRSSYGASTSVVTIKE